MTTLYRLFGEDGTLLYVGISDGPLHRMVQHEIHQRWWHEVRSATFENYASRELAEEAETYAIRTEHPVYNIRDNIEPGALTDYEARRMRRAIAEARLLSGDPDYMHGPYVLPCPACEAPDFEPCARLSGTARDEPHAARVKAHQRAFCSACGSPIAEGRHVQNVRSLP